MPRLPCDCLRRAGKQPTLEDMHKHFVHTVEVLRYWEGLQPGTIFTTELQAQCLALRLSLLDFETGSRLHKLERVKDGQGRESMRAV